MRAFRHDYALHDSVPRQHPLEEQSRDCPTQSSGTPTGRPKFSLWPTLSTDCVAVIRIGHIKCNCYLFVHFEASIFAFLRRYNFGQFGRPMCCTKICEVKNIREGLFINMRTTRSRSFRMPRCEAQTYFSLLRSWLALRRSQHSRNAPRPAVCFAALPSENSVRTCH